MKQKIPIDQLLQYWIDISRRPTLTPEDYVLFFDRAEATENYFSKAYPLMRSRDRFFEFVGVLLLSRHLNLKQATKWKRLPNHAYVLMKDVANKFIRRIKKYFAQSIVVAIDAKTPVQDAQELLSYSAKLTYRWAAGIVISNHLANTLIRLSRSNTGGRPTDDIITLYANLKNRTNNQRLKAFLVRSHRRFEDADKLRNRCAHVIQGDPTKQEIEQSISLARLLQKHR